MSHESLLFVALVFSPSTSFMLKIWKRTWNPDDPRPMRDSDQEDISGGPSSIASFVVAGAATPPSDAILPSVLPLGSSRGKRTRTSKELEDLVDDQPHKKSRQHRQPASSSLGNHLPEINDVGKLESLIPRSISAFREQVLEQAKRENSEFGLFLQLLHTTYITLQLSLSFLR
jgi:endoribonuclease Dicer